LNYFVQIISCLEIRDLEIQSWTFSGLLLPLLAAHINQSHLFTLRLVRLRVRLCTSSSF